MMRSHGSNDCRSRIRLLAHFHTLHNLICMENFRDFMTGDDLTVFLDLLPHPIEQHVETMGEIAK